MIGVEKVRELVETVIMTGKVKGVNPISLLLIAAPESGKTSIVLSKDCTNVHAFSDITGRGIHLAIKDNKEITHFVINDMVAVLSHRQSVNKYTISVLNAMTEEGISDIASPAGIEKFPDEKRGVITSLTTDLVSDSRNWWNKIGFASRMLPFCYSYPEALIVKIKDAIDHNNIVTKKGDAKKENFPTPKESIKVIYDEKLAKEVRRTADIRCMILEEQGMRRLKQYHALVQAHALLRHRIKPEVLELDIEWLQDIDMYVTYDKPRHL